MIDFEKLNLPLSRYFSYAEEIFGQFIISPGG